MSGEPSQQDGAMAGAPPPSAVRHVDVIGGEASHNSPMRWVLVTVPALLIIPGGAYLLGLWTEPLQRAPDERRAKAQRPSPTDRAARPKPPAPERIVSREGAFMA